MDPTPKTLVQNKPLSYKPQYTQCESRSTPVVMHICRESRAEYLYREDDAANNVEGKSHALYTPMFRDEDGKLSFFSFEMDALHLMSFSKLDPPLPGLDYRLTCMKRWLSL